VPKSKMINIGKSNKAILCASCKEAETLLLGRSGIKLTYLLPLLSSLDFVFCLCLRLILDCVSTSISEIIFYFDDGG